MSPIICISCHLTPATIFCQTDAAHLCDICDITIHQPSKISRKHERIRLHSFRQQQEQHHDQTIPLSTTTSFQDQFQDQYQDQYQEHSETDSTLQVVPQALSPHHSIQYKKELNLLSPHISQTSNDTTMATQSDASIESIPFDSIESTNKHALAAIADAYVKQEAESLLKNTVVYPTHNYQQQNPYSQPNFSFGENSFSNPYWSNTTTPAESSVVLPDARVPDAVLTQPSYSNGMNAIQVASIDNELLTRLLQVQQVLSSTLPLADVSNIGSDISFENEVERIKAQRRLDRQAALKRFRTKRANRSFQKKVRYACRKQLADSRPRVKGRFVGRISKTPSTNPVVSAETITTKS